MPSPGRVYDIAVLRPAGAFRLVTGGKRCLHAGGLSMTSTGPLDPTVVASSGSAILTLSAHAAGTGQVLAHHWSRTVGAGRANEGLRADWQRQLRDAVRDCGFRSVRFHGLFHDDMFVLTEDATGRRVLNFQYVDALFDALLEMGIRPFVEFAFAPRPLARTTDTVFWWRGHGAPPTDLRSWATLISDITLHWVARYGLSEVRRWTFEVWNEPNLRPFFHGTRSEYFALYETTARAVKNVDPELQIGGPATSNFVPDNRFEGEQEDTDEHEGTLAAEDLDSLPWRPVWVEAFLSFCRAREVPVDFISVHPYPTDWALDEHGQSRKLTRGVAATETDLRTLRQIMQSHGYGHLKVHLTEWSSSSSSRDFLQAATFVVRTAIQTIGLADSLAYWTFTDIFEEDGAGSEALHGGFGMVTLQGVPKPTRHAFRMLNALGDELLASSDCGIVTRDSDTGKLSALIYHYPPEFTQSVPASFDTRGVAWRIHDSGRSADLRLRLDGLPPRAPFLVEILDGEHGDVMTAWRALGEPVRWTKSQTRVLDRLANATALVPISSDDQGVLDIRRKLHPWSVVLLTQA